MIQSQNHDCGKINQSTTNQLFANARITKKKKYVNIFCSAYRIISEGICTSFMKTFSAAQCKRISSLFADVAICGIWLLNFRYWFANNLNMRNATWNWHFSSVFFFGEIETSNRTIWNMRQLSLSATNWGPGIRVIINNILHYEFLN